VEFLELRDAVAADAPAEDFLVDVGEADAGGELGEVGVDFDRGVLALSSIVLRRSRLARSRRRDRAAEFGFDLVRGADELEAGGGEGDALAQLVAVPQVGRAVGGLDEDEGLLAVVDDDGLGGELLAGGARGRRGRGCSSGRP
jgi:hypothetical protein